MPIELGADNNDNNPNKLGLHKAFADVPKLVPEVTARPIVPVAAGYYVISYKRKDEGSTGRNYYVVTDHTNIEKFVIDRLAFGEITKDIKIIEKIEGTGPESYVEAVSIATVLTLEENFEGGIKKFRLGGLLKAKYTWAELWGRNTKLKWY